MKHSTVALLGVGMLGCAAALPAGQLANSAQDNPSLHNHQARQVAGTNEEGMIPPGFNYVFGTPPVIPFNIGSGGMTAPANGFNADAFGAAFLGGGALPSPSSTSTPAFVAPAAISTSATDTAAASISSPATGTAVTSASTPATPSPATVTYAASTATSPSSAATAPTASGTSSARSAQ
ncbi:hypothetical protein BJX65DRAFT_312025 [Aspergillus insuetus]